jgi:peptidoglycan/LPS O-acetylase OafA/YrhL
MASTSAARSVEPLPPGSERDEADRPGAGCRVELVLSLPAGDRGRPPTHPIRWATMGSERPSGSPRVRLPEFLAGDPIRGFGVLAIITAHAAGVTLEPSNGGGGQFVLEMTSITGGFSLALFFSLSGYLIARPFVFAVVSGSRLPRISSYARNRVLRIVPAYWFVFTVVLLVYGTKGVSQTQIVSTYGFIGGWTDIPLAQFLGQAWTLRVEAFFYLLVPISAWLLFGIMRRLGAGLRLRTAVVIGVPLAVAATVAYVEPVWTWDPSNPILHLDLFMPGVMLAALETFLPARIERRTSPHRATARFGITLVAVATVTIIYCGILFQPFHTQSVALKGTLVFLVLTALLGGPLFLQWWTGGCWRLLDNRVFRWVGQRSYSIYLVHGAVLAELAPRLERALDDSYWLTFVVVLVAGIAGSVLLGVVVFRLVEAPFMNLKTSSWRTSQRAALFRRAALWIPSPRRVRALVERVRGAVPAMRRSRDEPAPEPAPTAEPSRPPTVPGT